MCRAIFIEGLNNKKETKEMVNYLTVRYAMSSMERGNNDGYFVTDFNQSLRTMDGEVYLKTLNKLTGKRRLLHLRLSTNRVKEKFIHGWKFYGYYCVHNGIMSVYGETGNDSLDFFKLLFSEGEPSLEKIKILLEEEGSGAIYWVRRDGKGFFASVNHPSYVTLFRGKDGGEVLTIISQADLNSDVKPDCRVKYTWSYYETEAWGVLPLRKKKTETFEDVFDATIVDKYSLTFNNKLVVMENWKAVSIHKLDPVDSYYYNKPYGKAGFKSTTKYK